MSDTVNPDVQELEQDSPAEDILEQQSEVVDYSGKSLSDLSELFQQFAHSEDRLQRAKEAEALKSAFYKTLLKEKEKAEAELSSVLDQVEESFKALYASYKKEKAEYNRKLDAEKEQNLKQKEALIAELKALLDSSDDVSAVVPQFRDIQTRWRATGAVPAQNFRDLNSNYQLYVEQFYDKLKINSELRELDFKKNYEAKTELCEKAEALVGSENLVEAFRELQKLHDAWKDLGPVAKQYREEIWERFKAATTVLNKNYQAYFEGVKVEQAENLKAKEVLCEKVEAIAAQEVKDSKVWNELSKEITSIQEEWRKIGFATRKDNQKVYDRFRAACDKFFEAKRNFYNSFKNDLEENYARKEAICVEAEQLKTSTDWKQTTERFIELQKAWKEIGAVPRKKSDAIWKRFRAACDEFFAEKDKNAKPAANDYYANLKAKQRIIQQILEYKSADEESDRKAFEEFSAAFNALGFVPFKEKENVSAAYKAAIAKAFPNLQGAQRRGSSRGTERVISEKDKLLAQYRALEQEVATKENNILFFAHSKANALIDQMQASIESGKKELAEIEKKILAMEKEEKEAEQN